MSLVQEAFEVLHENLASVDSGFAERREILCPVCLTAMTEAEVLRWGVDHIIPESFVSSDPDAFKDLATKNRRCGITVLCRHERLIRGIGKKVSGGCNSFKGAYFDRSLMLLRKNRERELEKQAHRIKVAIFVMAYLGAFQTFGYGYILRSELDEVRRQFDSPDEQVSRWLDTVFVSLKAMDDGVVATETGQPFMFGNLMTKNVPLRVQFRWCAASLPGGHWEAGGVRTLESLFR